jgi:hypothetical protein
VDVLLVNRDAPAHLLRNTVPGRGRWLSLRVVEEHGRDALGAVVTMKFGGRAVTRWVRAAASYCSSNDPRIHVGLGAAAGADEVVVRWVDGTREAFDAPKAGAVTTLKRGAGRRL